MIRIAEIVASGYAAVILAVGWFHGFTGHRTCRVLHMRMTGRVSDVAFQPVTWHPRDTPGHPKIMAGDDKGKLEQGTCKRLRMATRAAVLLTAVLLAVSLYYDAPLTAVGLLAAELAVMGVYMRYVAWRVHRIRLCRPMASPLASVLAYHMRLGAADLCEGMTVAEDGNVERIEVPSTYLSFDRNNDEVNAILRDRMPLQRAEWHLEASFPFIDMLGKVQLPKPGEVRWADLTDYIAACGRGEYVIGVDEDGVHTLSFRKHPHHAWSFATGRGKSTLLRSVVVQMLAQDPGNRVVCLDTKRVSLEQIVGIRGLTYCNDPADIPAMCAAVAEVKREMDARYAERAATGRRTFPRLLLVLEEAADLDRAVTRWWGKKGVPPIWDDVVSILRQGREVDVNVLMVTQDFDNRRYGGLGLRNLFELIVMSGWSDPQWDNCIGTKPVPRPEPGAGRLVVCHGREQVPVQAMTAERGEMLDYLMEMAR